MNEILAKLGRKNHLNHLINVMPLITFVYGVQCFLIYRFGQDIDVGDYALFLGLGLASFISTLVFYDNNHHVFICKKHLHIYFALTGTDYQIPYSDIKEIIAPEEESNFSSLIIRDIHKKTFVFYFVDYPLSVKTMIEQLKMELEDKATQNDEDHFDDQKAA